MIQEQWKNVKSCVRQAGPRTRKTQRTFGLKAETVMDECHANSTQGGNNDTTEKLSDLLRPFPVPNRPFPTDRLQKYTNNTQTEPRWVIRTTGLWTLLHVIWVGYITNTNDNIVLQQIYMCKCEKCFNWELRFLLSFLACSRGKIVQLTREGLTNLRRVCLLTNILGGSALREIPTEG